MWPLISQLNSRAELYRSITPLHALLCTNSEHSSIVHLTSQVLIPLHALLCTNLLHSLQLPVGHVLLRVHTQKDTFGYSCSACNFLFLDHAAFYRETNTRLRSS